MIIKVRTFNIETMLLSSLQTTLNSDSYLNNVLYSIFSSAPRSHIAFSHPISLGHFNL